MSIKLYFLSFVLILDFGTPVEYNAVVALLRGMLVNSPRSSSSSSAA
jgi:hypothetical protein